MALININEFQQTPVRGQLDLQIAKSGVLSGQISANEAGSPKAGDFVKLDPAATGATPQFLLAAQADLAIGVITHDVKKDSPVVGDVVNVGGLLGPVIWAVANETITPQEQLQSNANGNMEALAAGKFRGIALDPATVGQLFRMMVLTNVAPAA